MGFRPKQTSIQNLFRLHLDQPSSKSGDQGSLDVTENLHINPEVKKWMFPKKWWYPKMDGLSWKTLSKWMIWGYHYFRKHPNESMCIVIIFCKSLRSIDFRNFPKVGNTKHSRPGRQYKYHHWRIYKNGN